MPAKYVFYELVQKSETMLPTSPHVKLLEKYKGDPSFQKKLRIGLVELLSAVRDRVGEIWTNKQEMTPNHIALSIPSTLGPEFESKYSDIVIEVFNVEHQYVSFVNE